MKVLNGLLGLPLILLALGCDNIASDRGGRLEPDNTSINERDAEGHTTTPFDQSNDQRDIDLVAKIRSEVVAVDNMSVSGKNVKIITNQGKVMLRGPVASAAEKESIERIAIAAAGEGNVTNKLEVDKD